jgi:DNA-binding GntR family transcriptional regulator
MTARWRLDECSEAGIALGELGGCLGIADGLVPEVDQQQDGVPLVMEYRHGPAGRLQRLGSRGTSRALPAQPRLGRDQQRCPQLSPIKGPAQQVRLAILEEITSGRLRPGDRLPSELEQAHGFKVSRAVVREALRSLAQLGLITTVQGRGGGSFVNHLEHGPVQHHLQEAMGLLLDFDEINLAELVDARRALEGTAARLGATRRGEGELAAMAEAINRSRNDTLAADAWLELDIHFHRAVVSFPPKLGRDLRAGSLPATRHVEQQRAVDAVLCRSTRYRAPPHATDRGVSHRLGPGAAPPDLIGRRRLSAPDLRDQDRNPRVGKSSTANVPRRGPLYGPSSVQPVRA